MLPSTEIFSKRRKIYSSWKGAGVAVTLANVYFINHCNCADQAVSRMWVVILVIGRLERHDFLTRHEPNKRAIEFRDWWTNDSGKPLNGMWHERSGLIDTLYVLSQKLYLTVGPCTIIKRQEKRRLDTSVTTTSGGISLTTAVCHKTFVTLQQIMSGLLRKKSWKIFETLRWRTKCHRYWYI